MKPDLHEREKFTYAIYLLLGAALVHGTWGVCVLRAVNDEKELTTTGLCDVYGLFLHCRWATGIGLILFSIMALAAIRVHKYSTFASLCLVIPQQLIMLVSCWRAYICIRDGTFADGLPYNPNFITADQCYQFWFCLMHSALIVHSYLWEGLNCRRNLSH